MQQTDDQDREKRLLARLVVLGALIVCVNLWLTLHLGWSVKSIFASGVVVTAMTWTRQLVSKDRQGVLGTVLRASMLALVRTSVLLPVCLAFVLVGFTYSSIRVVGDGSLGDDGVKVRISPIGGDAELTATLTESEPAKRWLCQTSGGGRAYVIKAEGYLERTFMLSPWVGTVIRVGELERAPCLLLRLPPGQLDSADMGTIELFSVASAGGEPRLLGAIKLNDHRAVLIGKPSGAWRDFDMWKRELKVWGEPDNSIDPALFRWSKPRFVDETAVPLRPGMIIEARLRIIDEATGEGKVLASATILVTHESLQDVMLISGE
jgi:hypothetical protein